MKHPHFHHRPFCQLALWPTRTAPNFAMQLLDLLRARGVVTSLFGFVADHGHDYSSAHRVARWMADRGHLHVWTRPGYPTVFLPVETSLQHGEPVTLRTDRTFRGLMLARHTTGRVLVMVTHRGHTDYAARTVADIDEQILVGEGVAQ